MEDVQCVLCGQDACTGDIEDTPEFCPRRNATAAVEQAETIRTTDTDVKRIAEVARSVETDGYRKWPRVRELIEFSKRMGLAHLGVAFCVGLREEAGQLARILESHGLGLSSVACTVNGGCNPVGQALALNSQGTQLNVIVGLCMGHDVLFSKFSEAPVTTLVVKDRAMCHNPVAPLMNRYWRDTFLAEDAQTG
jgi:uncharacterized metal-binding protein